MRPIRSARGFTLVEMMVGIAILGASIVAIVTYLNASNRSLTTSRATFTRDRILSSYRKMAGMPASLRNSMRAGFGGTPVNPELKSCLVGNSSTKCQSNVIYPFTLYYYYTPQSGQVIPMTMPSPLPGQTAGSSGAGRIDFFGNQCSTPSPSCALRVFTSFRALCGPVPIPSPAPTPLTPDFVAPLGQCTVADVIEVFYLIDVDPAFASQGPGFNLKPFGGSVVVPVAAISGNSAQP